MYECVIYNYGSSIFNKDGYEKRYRPNVNEIQRITFTQDDVYENKKITKCLIYLTTANNPNPIVNICFASDSSVKRYIKANKVWLSNNFGKLGEDYFYQQCIFSHDDVRAI